MKAGCWLYSGVHLRLPLFPARSLSAHGHFSQARNAFYQEVRSQFFRSWASPYPSTIDLTAGVNPVPDQRPPPFQPPAALPAEAIDWFTIANASNKERDCPGTAVPGTLFEHH